MGTSVQRLVLLLALGLLGLVWALAVAALVVLVVSAGLVGRALVVLVALGAVAWEELVAMLPSPIPAPCTTQVATRSATTPTSERS